MKVIKVLHEWPLSKVELVEIRGGKFILKTIHKDFVNEVTMQIILRKICKKTKIPKIYWKKKSNGKITFLMEYINEKPKKITRKESLM